MLCYIEADEQGPQLYFCFDVGSIWKAPLILQKMQAIIYEQAKFPSSIKAYPYHYQNNKSSNNHHPVKEMLTAVVTEEYVK